MVAAGVVVGGGHERCKKLRKGHRRPHHRNGQSEEPLPELHTVDTHRPQRDEECEDGNAECRQPEVDGNQPIGDDGSDAAAVVRKAMVGVQPFTWLETLEQALVGLTGIQERHHRDDTEDGHCHHQQTHDKVGLLIVHNIFETEHRRGGILLVLLLFLRHNCRCWGYIVKIFCKNNDLNLEMPIFSHFFSNFANSFKLHQ